MERKDKVSFFRELVQDGDIVMACYHFQHGAEMTNEERKYSLNTGESLKSFNCTF